MNHYQIVKEVINDWDPMNFLSFSSEDEYDPEISRIVSRLPTASVEKLAVVIHEVFDEMFSRSRSRIPSINNCYPSALKIWDKIYNNKFPNLKKRY
ncbi:protein of unknown function [Psychrobacillus psychrotolerans]|uniref:DUF1871 domain-containing protein n=1 Tax=Psychrobacillus psychrotolerans TaxID=126156 RepID=A0A1I6B224_9BACI|nr:DUF1871 family protein [Psychrobacillus psychrotolerans]SFQ74956.1 protein of unknown function [Psychrobacillus psychrotolerans]